MWSDKALVSLSKIMWFGVGVGQGRCAVYAGVGAQRGYLARV